MHDAFCRTNPAFRSAKRNRAPKGRTSRPAGSFVRVDRTGLSPSSSRPLPSPANSLRGRRLLPPAKCGKREKREATAVPKRPELPRSHPTLTMPSHRANAPSPCLRPRRRSWSVLAAFPALLVPRPRTDPPFEQTSYFVAPNRPCCGIPLQPVRSCYGIEGGQNRAPGHQADTRTPYNALHATQPRPLPESSFPAPSLEGTRPSSSSARTQAIVRGSQVVRPPRTRAHHSPTPPPARAEPRSPPSSSTLPLARFPPSPPDRKGERCVNTRQSRAPLCPSLPRPTLPDRPTETIGQHARSDRRTAVSETSPSPVSHGRSLLAPLGAWLIRAHNR